MSAQFARLDSHDPADSGLRMATKFELGDREVMRKRLRHAQALRLGRPFTYAEIEDELSITLDHCTKGSALQECSLRGRNLAYLQGKRNESHTVVLRDIVTGSTAMFYGSAREQIRALALSHEMLAYANRSGKAYIIEVADTTKTHCVRLPSSNLQAMDAEGSRVAILLVDTRGSHTATVVLYDLVGNATTSFRFAYQADAHPHNSCITPQTLRLDVKSGIIDVFGAALALSIGSGGDDHGMTQYRVGHMRLSLTGAVVCSSIETWWEDLEEENTTADPDPDTLPSILLGALSSMGRPGLYLLPGETKPMSFLGKRWSLIFDAVHAKFYNADIFCDEPCPSVGGSHQVIWKGCMYRSEAHGTLNTTRVYPIAKIGSVRFQQAGTQNSIENLEDLSTSTTGLLMNDSYIVELAPIDHKLLVMCFDEDVHIPGAKPTALWECCASHGDRSFVDDFSKAGDCEQHILKSMPFSTRTRKPRVDVHWPMSTTFDDRDEYVTEFGVEF